MVSLRELVRYLLWRTGCIHPFRISRIIAFAELRYLEDKGSRMTNIRYVSGPGVFFIEGLKEIVESDNCISKREGDPEKGVKGCIEYVCNNEPVLDEEVRRYVDEAVKEASGEDDISLNSKVMNHPLFKSLTM